MNNALTDHDQTARAGGRTAFGEILTEANRQWRHIGVRRTDRHEMLTELDDELGAAYADGYGSTAVLGDDRPEMFRQWAHERGVSGRALRLHLVVPAALAGIAVGLAFIVGAAFLAFAGKSTFYPGELLAPLYVMSVVFAYLCALVFGRGALAAVGDPHTGITVKWLAALLPIGAALTTGAAVALAWWRDFSATTAVFSAVIVVVVAGLAVTIGLARHVAVTRAHARPQAAADGDDVD